MSKIVTVKELEDCALDAQTFGDAANGAPGVKVKARLGRVYWTLATYDKRFNDRADLFDKMYVDYDSTLATKAKAFDDSLVKKNKEFDDARVQQVLIYTQTLNTKVDEFDTTLNQQVTKYDQVLGDKVVEYDIKINSVDAEIRDAKNTADDAKRTADQALEQTKLDPATTEVLGGVKIGSGLSITAGGVLSTIASVDDLDVLLYSPIPYSKNIAPTGFLIMMGQSISSSQHPKLYARYGSRLPDMRAHVLRGWDNGRGIDVGRTLLSEQVDAVRNITGYIGNSLLVYSNGATGALYSTSGGGGYGGGVNGVYTHLNFDASRVVPTASENRVKSIAVNYIVKAG